MYVRGVCTTALVLLIGIGGLERRAALADEAECYGDLNADGERGLADVATLLGHYGATGAAYEDGDLDGDADVDLTDLAQLLGVYGEPCPIAQVVVPGGTFEMGDPWNEGGIDERPVHAVSLDGFQIFRYAVTNQQYAVALNWARKQGGLITVADNVVYQAGSGTDFPYCALANPYDASRITWDGARFGVTPGKEHHPMTYVSWYGAAAYCNWRSAMEGRELCFDPATWVCDFSKDGYRLPTEAEWEKAAGWDPVQQRHYRYGEHSDGCGYNCLDGQRANYGTSGDPYEDGPSPKTTPVGFYDGGLHEGFQTQDAQSYYGCYDMSGNQWEWCYDWYSSSYYSESPTSNPTGPESGTARVQRGGAWDYHVYNLRSANRTSSLPSSHYAIYGFRCAASGS